MLKMFLFRILLASICLSFAAANDSDKTCIAPEVVTQLESQLEGLQQDKASSITTLARCEEGLKELKVQNSALEKAASTADEAASRIDSLTKEVAAKELEISNLKKELATSKEEIVKAAADLHASKSKPNDNVEQLSKKLSDLENELLAAKDRLNLDVWLSKAFDITVESIETGYEHALVHSKNLYEVSLQYFEKDMVPMINQTLGQTDKVKAMVVETYRKHCKETLDPVLEKAKTAAQPYIEAYEPVVREIVGKVGTQSSLVFREVDSKTRELRQTCIDQVKTYPQLEKYAERMVDISIGLSLCPVLYFVLPWLWKLVFGILFNIIGLLCCCFCCGCCSSRKKEPKKKKVSKKKKATNKKK